MPREVAPTRTMTPMRFEKIIFTMRRTRNVIIERVL